MKICEGIVLCLLVFVVVVVHSKKPMMQVMQMSPMRMMQVQPMRMMPMQMARPATPMRMMMMSSSGGMMSMKKG